MSLVAARIAMQAIARHSSDPEARDFAMQALDALRSVVEAPPEALTGETPEERRKRLARARQATYAANKKKPKAPPVADAKTVSKASAGPPDADAPADARSVSADAPADAADVSADARPAGRAISLDQKLSEEREQIQDSRLSSDLGGTGGRVAPLLTLTHVADSVDAPASASAKRERRRGVATLPADPDDPRAWEAWCAKWKLDARSDDVRVFANWHLGKGITWTHWGRAWLDWLKKPSRVHPESGSGVHRTAQANGRAPMTEAEKGAATRAERERRAIEGR